VRLPYTKGLHSDVILPPQGTDPGAATPEILAELNRQLFENKAKGTEVMVQLPTLDTQAKGVDAMDLIPALKALGVTDIFDLNADLSGISQTDALAVSQVVQQSVLKVDRHGTRAAAVTQIAAVEASAPLDPTQPIVFTVDRPYLFTISHSATEWLLFYAAITDPRH
jgi:serine protease inhibitor